MGRRSGKSSFSLWKIICHRGLEEVIKINSLNRKLPGRAHNSCEIREKIKRVVLLRSLSLALSHPPPFLHCFQKNFTLANMRCWLVNRSAVNFEVLVSIFCHFWCPVANSGRKQRPPENRRSIRWKRDVICRQRLLALVRSVFCMIIRVKAACPPAARDPDVLSTDLLETR